MLNFKNILHITSSNPKDTAIIAQAVASSTIPGTIVSLSGDLGAGKTTFSQAFAEKLGVSVRVTSPTFVLQKIYETLNNLQGIEQLVHYDVYRLQSYHELVDLGFDDHPPGAVILIEWGDKFADYFPDSALYISLQRTGESQRKILISSIDLNQIQSIIRNLNLPESSFSLISKAE